MPEKCKKCDTDITLPKEAFKCKDCSSLFHQQCIGDAKRKCGTRSNWKCEDCASECSSNGSRASQRDSDGAVLDAIAAFRKENNDRWDQQAIKLGEMQANIANIVKDVSDLNQQCQQLKVVSDNNLTDVQSLKDENVRLSNEVRILNKAVADLEQQTRKSNILITGVPLTANEDIFVILKSIAGILDIDFHYSDVSATHRLPGSTQSSRPPIIIVSFVSRATKLQWVSARKRCRSLSADQLSTKFPKNIIYINEHLTQENRDIFNSCRELVKSSRLVSVWISDCRVLAKKTLTGRPFRIHSLRQLRDLGISAETNKDMETVKASSTSPLSLTQPTVVT